MKTKISLIGPSILVFCLSGCGASVPSGDQTGSAQSSRDASVGVSATSSISSRSNISSAFSSANLSSVSSSQFSVSSVKPGSSSLSSVAPSSKSASLVSSSSFSSSLASSRSSSAEVGIGITPASVTLNTHNSQYFACTLGNEPDLCDWKVSEVDGGSVDVQGLYVAPNRSGTFHLIATSRTDPSKSASATLTVTAPIGGCNDLAPVGTWENITPKQLNQANWCVPGSHDCSPEKIGTYGVNQFAIDPSNPGTILLGTAGFGIWKSTNCGSNWEKINTGKNHEVLDTGRQNTFYIDPANPNILYTMALYGTGIQGFYQSTNGGVDWEQVVTKEVLDVVAGGFFAGVAQDPTNPGHFVAFPHDNCGGTPPPGAALAPDGRWGCLAEGHYANGVWEWKVVTSPFPPYQGDGVWASMVDSKIWLLGNLWRTVTGGVPPQGGGPASAWTKVYPGPGEEAYTGYCYVSSIGTIYCGQAQQPLVFSKDKGETWTLSNSPRDVAWVADDGITLYMGVSNNSFFSAPMSPTEPVGVITQMSSPEGAILGPAQIKYDKNYNILYSSNLTGGFWRVVTK